MATHKNRCTVESIHRPGLHQCLGTGEMSKPIELISQHRGGLHLRDIGTVIRESTGEITQEMNLHSGEIAGIGTPVAPAEDHSRQADVVMEDGMGQC